MRRNIMRLAFITLLTIAVTITANPDITIKTQENIIQTQIHFSNYKLEAFNKVYNKITIPGLANIKSHGKPSLPFYTFKALIPAGKEIKTIQVKGTPIFSSLKNKIKPAATSIPWFIKEKRKAKLAVEDAIYNKRGQFPGYLHSNHILSFLAGYPIVTFNIYPIQYHLGKKELAFYKTINVIIELQKSRKQTKVRDDFEKRVKKLVVNPRSLKTFQVRSTKIKHQKNYQYILITTKKLLDLDIEYGFEYLVDFFQSRGINAIIVTLEEIYEQYQGVDKADQVRNFIKYAFENWNTSYVLLGGDGDKGNEIFPVRRFKIRLHYVYADGSSITVNEKMASDYYFSALDGDFNANQNAYYGEIDDNIDLEYEVAVGRAPVDNKEEVENFVRKTVQAYLHADTVDKPKVLMLGEHLFSPGNCGVSHHIYGADFMNKLYYGSNNHGFYTHGFRSTWQLGKLYEKEARWGKNEVIQELSHYGACWVNHIGHSSPSYNMHLYKFYISSIKNEIPFLYFTQGCNAGRFTNESTAPLGKRKRGSDCISEALVNGKYGAYAVISNWSYGLSPEDPETSSGDTPGASQYFHRYFVDAFFNPHVQYTKIGDMLSYSKQQMNSWLLDPQMDTDTVRWCYYQVNLLGDPGAPLPKK